MKQGEEQMFNFSMSIGTLQMILNVLYEVPYKQSATIISDLISQYNSQVKVIEEKIKEEKNLLKRKE